MAPCVLHSRVRSHKSPDWLWCCAPAVFCDQWRNHQVVSYSWDAYAYNRGCYKCIMLYCAVCIIIWFEVLPLRSVARSSTLIASAGKSCSCCRRRNRNLLKKYLNTFVWIHSFQCFIMLSPSRASLRYILQ